MHSKRTIEDVDFHKKKVIIRVDFNVPLDTKGQIADDFRLRSSIPTIDYILKQDTSVILMSHLGRPKGKIKEEMRLEPVYNYLKNHYGSKVHHVTDCIGEEVNNAVSRLQLGEILLLENLRFHPEETINDPEFSKTLASYADIYVNDAFGTAHRSHASTVGITKYIPAVAGYLIMKELVLLVYAVENPQHPFTAIIGGKKIKDKIKVLKSILEKCDNLLIGGGMAFTFLKAQGNEIGTSIIDVEGVEIARDILKSAELQGKSLILPEDIVIADSVRENANIKVVSPNEIPVGWQGLDIGPKTIQKYKKIINKSQMVVWNGPVGVFELERFSHGTQQLAQILAESQANTIVGGGDTIAAVRKFGLITKMTHSSTGGGASLALLEGKTLPAIQALNELQ